MIRSGALLALVALVVLPCRPAGAIDAALPGPGWEEANRTADYVIFTKDNDAANARDVLAVTEVTAPPAAVDRALSDFAHFVDFMPAVKEARVLKTLAENDFLVYQELHLPLVSNRDFVIRLKRTPGSAANGGVFRHDWTCAEATDVPEKKGIVRITLNTGAWIMEPLAGGKRTRIRYELLTTPGGSVPKWIANKSNTLVIPDLLDALKKRSLDPTWKLKK